MNYFEFTKHSCQAVFGLMILFIFVFFVPIFGQETTDKAVESDKTPENINETATLTKDDAPKLTVETLTAKNFVSLSKPENQRFRDFSFSIKSAEKQQNQPDDDPPKDVLSKDADGIKLGGHVGFVVPIVGRGNGVTTSVADRFVFGFPVGLTVKTKKNIAIDFEFIPTFNTGRDFVLTIHPGIIYGFAKNYAVGVRAAYDAGAGSFGLTPLIARSFKINNKVGWFIEADFPIRSNYRAFQSRFGSIAFAAHTGIAF